jgi:5-methyltetrahydrofolate--homocysteine methyltransferase
MDDAMLDSTREMERFVRYISNDPAVAKAALMIDSSHWDTIIAGLTNAQGKCIVNSISLKEGPEKFLEKAKAIKELGAAVVVMAFDEEGQATTFDRKIEICSRAYKLLTEEAGLSPENIIFDANILSIGTGIEEHARYAIDFIEAVRWIKANLPGALTSGGVSNLSFSFRGNNAVREAMHSAFLYHAVKAGLDMAIVNPSMLQVYDEIDPELLKCVEDVIFDTDPQATERLIDKASRMLMEKETASESKSDHGKSEDKGRAADRLKTSLIKGRSETLAADLNEALAEYGNAVSIIEGPLMEGMETVGKMFGEGKMFLPQVVKSAKVMRDAVEILQPYMNDSQSDNEQRQSRPKIVIATVKGDVHDIGKNITGIVLTCNGFDIRDLGVMVDKETILKAAEDEKADIIAVSGLITPSLYQMEEICREMSARNMTTPLFIGGATTSAVHTAVKLAPLYGHVFHGPDASAAAVMAKRYMMDPEGFEKEEHSKQAAVRQLYTKGEEPMEQEIQTVKAFDQKTYLLECPADIPAQQIPSEEILPYFDWKMFYAIWGVKYGSSSMEAMELVQLRRDAEEEIALGNFKIMLTAKFYNAYKENNDIVIVKDNSGIEMNVCLPMLRQEKGEMRSLCDFVIDKESGKTSAFGCFAICVKAADAHEEGCCCPACSNKYEDLIGKAVRMTLAEAASKWLDRKLKSETDERFSIIKPAAGYSSCPDHTLKRDIFELLGINKEEKESCGHGDGCTCGHHHAISDQGMNIKLTESYAMIPEASICGTIFIHPEAKYHEIRAISQAQHDIYAEKRGMDAQTARRFLGHLLK